MTKTTTDRNLDQIKQEWIQKTARDIAEDLWKLKLEAAESDEDVERYIKYMAEQLLDDGFATIDIRREGTPNVCINVYWQRLRYGSEFTAVEVNQSSCNFDGGDQMRAAFNWLGRVQDVVSRIEHKVQSWPRKLDAEDNA